MTGSLQIKGHHDPAAVGRILRALPEWFGVASAIDHYVEAAATKRSHLAVLDHQVIGVALLEPHTIAATEIFLIAVDPAHHGHGIGSALVSAIEDDLRAAGTRLLQVHTVGPSHPDEHYAATRAFYLARGFLPLQELRGIDWDGPTLILVKPLEVDRPSPADPNETCPSRSLRR